MQHELIRFLMIKMSPKLFWLLFSLSVWLIFLTKKSIYADESQTSLKGFVIIWQIWSIFIKNFVWTHFGEDPKNLCEALSKEGMFIKNPTMSTQVIFRKSYIHKKRKILKWISSVIKSSILDLVWVIDTSLVLQKRFQKSRIV